MLDMDEINREISRLEKEDMTYRTCEKLSVLYSVRDAYRGSEKPIQRVYDSDGYSYANAPKMPESEFLQATEGKDMRKVLEVIDKHLEAVKVLYPKEFSMVIQKIREV